jgi:hypothetical protein
MFRSGYMTKESSYVKSDVKENTVNMTIFNLGSNGNTKKNVDAGTERKNIADKIITRLGIQQKNKIGIPTGTYTGMYEIILDGLTRIPDEKILDEKEINRISDNVVQYLFFYRDIYIQQEPSIEGKRTKNSIYKEALKEKEFLSSIIRIFEKSRDEPNWDGKKWSEEAVKKGFFIEHKGVLAGIVVGAFASAGTFALLAVLYPPLIPATPILYFFNLIQWGVVPAKISIPLVTKLALGAFGTGMVTGVPTGLALDNNKSDKNNNSYSGNGYGGFFVPHNESKTKETEEKHQTEKTCLVM